MSQFYLNSQGSPGVPNVESLTGNNAAPVFSDPSFNINVIGAGNILVTGTPLNNTLTITDTSLLSGTGTTVGATTADIITIPLGATPKTYKFRFDMASFNSSTPLGAGYFINATVRTTGVAATVVSVPDGDDDEEGALVAADWDVIASGNNAILRVTGVAGLSINWVAQGYFLTAS